MSSRALVVIAAVVVIGCGESPVGEPSVARVDLLAGTAGQEALVGTAVPNPLGVTIRETTGKPIAGVEVAFAVSAGGGTVTPASVRTDAAGIARVHAWILGEEPGENMLAATVGSLTSAIRAVARAGPVSQLEKVGDAQLAIVNTAVPVPPGVIVRDRFRNPVPNVSVSFVVLSGGGWFDATAATSDAAGLATPGSWILGTVAGVNTARATVVGALPVDFIATGRVGAATLLTKTGDRQSAIVGRDVPQPIAVTVTDGHNNPVPNVGVVFEVVAGAGSLTGGTATTDSLGSARLGSWRLGTAAGPNELRVTAGTVTASFSATGTPDQPAALTLVAGNQQTDTVDAVLPARPTVRVSDRFGNPIAGIDVVFGVLSGGGRVTHVAPSDALGQASAQWTLGAAAGTNTLTALLPGVGQPVTFIATAEWPTFAASAFSVGRSHTCALNSAGRAYCWGANSSGQLGDGTRQARYLATAVAGNIAFKSIVAGAGWTCALSLSGIVYCWGGNSNGQLGDGTFNDRLVPGPVDGSAQFVSLSVGLLHTCGLSYTGDAYCWGWGVLGQLGNAQSQSNVPVSPSGGMKFRSVEAGALHTCGIAHDGAAYCWGEGTGGRLGTGDTLSRPVPALVTGGHAFASLGAGAVHTCGLATGGVLYCWGGNAVGMLGDGTVAERLRPTATAGNLRFASFGAGDANTCGITFDGGAYCWGANSACQLARGFCSNGPNPNPIAIALEATSAPRVSAIRVLSSGACATAAANQYLYCWGLNVGTGDSTNVVVGTPTRVRKR